MDPGAFMAMMQGLPYANPFMFLNLSGVCATTKLIQCGDFGVDAVEVSKKFNKRAEDVPDLGVKDFLARKDILKQIEAWCTSMQGKPEKVRGKQWKLILYQYELVKSSALKLRDWGHMLFVDPSLTCFLIVIVLGEDTCNCGNPFHDDYATLAKHHADRMMSLVKYIHHDKDSPQPKWVRATYVTDTKKLSPAFLDSDTASSPGSKAWGPVFHVTPQNFRPSLLQHEIEKIDNLLAQKPGLKTPPSSVKKAVMGSEDGEPDMGTMWLRGEEDQPRACAYCLVTDKVEKLLQCSRCKLVEYCGKECQKKAWKTHKLVCKKAEPPSS